MEIIKRKYSFRKGQRVDLDTIYDIQGLMPADAWVNEEEFNFENNIDEEESDDVVVFLTSIDIEYKVRLKKK